MQNNTNRRVKMNNVIKKGRGRMNNINKGRKRMNINNNNKGEMIREEGKHEQ